jgi:hypothetical protein
MNKKLLRYAELKKLIIDTEKEINSLKDEVFGIVHDAEGEKIETELGLFELRGGRAVWTYSEELTLKEKQVKEMLKLKRKEEEIKGIAKQESAPQNLVFTIKK